MPLNINKNTGPPVIEPDSSIRDGKVTFKAGVSMIVMVNIKGLPAPTAKWYRGDEEVLTGRLVSIEGDGTFSRWVYV